MDMNLSNSNNNIERIEKEAYEWLAIMNSDNKTKEDVVSFNNWLNKDSYNKIIYEEVECIWSSIELSEGKFNVNDYSHFDPFWLKLISPIHNFLSIINANKSPQITFFATLSILVIGAYYVLPGVFSEKNIIETNKAEIEDVILSDGSTITLGALSSIQIEFDQYERRIILSSGEAFFSVKKDEKRPFYVSTSNAELRAIGTQFDVRNSENGVRVSVLEGSIEITKILKEDLGGATNMVELGQILPANYKFNTNGSNKPEKINEEYPGAWRHGNLIYENAKLSEVISDVNRYSQNQIFIDGKEIKEYTVTASFRASQISQILTTLSTILPIKLIKQDSGTIFLKKDIEKL